MSAATNTPSAVPEGAMWASVGYFWRDVGSGPEFWSDIAKEWRPTAIAFSLQEYELYGVLKRIAPATTPADFRRPSDGPAQPEQPAPAITPALALMVAPLRDGAGLDVVAPFGQRRMWGAV